MVSGSTFCRAKEGTWLESIGKRLKGLLGISVKFCIGHVRESRLQS